MTFSSTFGISFVYNALHIFHLNEYTDLSKSPSNRWLKAGTSGMAIQEFGIPSGFEADLESIEKVVEIKRVESKDRKLVLYFNQVKI